MRYVDGKAVNEGDGQRLYEVIELMSLAADDPNEQLARAALRVSVHALVPILQRLLLDDGAEAARNRRS